MGNLSFCRTKSFFLFLLVSLLIITSAYSQETELYEKYVKHYVSTQKFMGSVLVAKNNRIVFNKGFGSANLEWNIPNTPETKFRLGSITKQFTAAAVLLLEEQKKLNTDDLLKKYFPDIPSTWENIKIFHLLTHSSGIPNFTNFPEYQEEQLTPHTPEEIVDIFRYKPLDFEPGEKMNYSNSGYIVLGCLIEKVSGKTYQDFLKKNIFDPLGMKDSGYDSNTAIIDHRAAGYSLSPKGYINAGYVHMSIPFSAGALYSTTEDLLRWEQGLFGGKLLSDKSLAKMITPYKNNYASGLTTGTDDGHKFIQHGGGIQGFMTHLAWYPDDKITIVVLSNVNSPAPPQLARNLSSIAHGEKVVLPSEKKEIDVPVEILSQYVGTYELTPGLNIMITLSGDSLISQVSGQGKIPIFAETETVFFLRVVDAQLEFIRDDSGKVTHLLLKQSGTENNAVKISDTVFERKEIKVSADILSQYAGTYELAPGFSLVVTQKDDHLMVQATGQPQNPVYAESETMFFYKVVDAQIEFLKDENGKVAHLILHQGPRDMKAKKKLNQGE